MTYGSGLPRASSQPRKLNVTPAAVTSYAPSDKDMSAQLLEIKDKGADSLILFRPPRDVTLGDQADERSRLKLATIGNAQHGGADDAQQSVGVRADGGYAIGGIFRDITVRQDPGLGQAACRRNTRYGRQFHRLISTPSIC